MSETEHPLTIPGALGLAARLHPGRDAVVDGGVRLTWARLDDRVRTAVKSLIALGIRPGDRIAVWAPNSHRWVVAALAAASAGAVLVPVNTRYRGAEASWLLERGGVRLLFVENGFLGKDYLAMLDTGRGPGDDGSAGARTAPPGTGGDLRRHRAPRHPAVGPLPAPRRAAGGLRGHRPERRGAPRRPVRPALHLRHDRPTQGRPDHAPAEPHHLPGLEQPHRSHRRRPLPDREPDVPLLRLQGRLYWPACCGAPRWCSSRCSTRTGSCAPSRPNGSPCCPARPRSTPNCWTRPAGTGSTSRRCGSR